MNQQQSNSPDPGAGNSSLSSFLFPLSSDKSTRWLITGGCGFIGRNLIKRLVEEGGHSILVIDNLKVGTRDDLAQVCEFQEISPSDISSSLMPPSPKDSSLSSSLFPLSSIFLIVSDILNVDLALSTCKGADIIIHLAANTGVAPSVADPRMDCVTNVIGTFNYLEAARQNGVKRFVFASSGAPVGEVEPPIHEELAPHPVSPYGASKLAGEGYCSAYFRTFGLETVCLRFGNVYGPLSGKKDSVIAKFIKQALAGEPVEIYGDGTQTRDFIHVSDLVDAICKAATLTPATPNPSSLTSNLYPLTSTPSLGGQTFQIATNREHTVNEVAEMLKTVLKEQCGIDMAITYGEPRLGDVKRNYSDTSKARKYLRWVPETDLEQGLARTVNWFLGG